MDATGFEPKEMFDTFGPLDYDVVGGKWLLDVNCTVVLILLPLLSGRVELRVVGIRGKAFLDVRYLFVARGHSVL
jgi:hypothetical protein